METHTNSIIYTHIYMSLDLIWGNFKSPQQQTEALLSVTAAFIPEQH